MSGYRFDDLARYNAERSRGIAHTPEWQERMAAQQAAFDAQIDTLSRPASESLVWRLKARIAIEALEKISIWKLGERPNPGEIVRGALHRISGVGIEPAPDPGHRGL